MTTPRLNDILADRSCVGAFRVTDDALVSLRSSGPGIAESAARMSRVWASLNTFMPDAATVIAKRGDSLTVASQKGGLILEAAGAFNIGLLRTVLSGEDIGLPPAPANDTPIAQPGTRALMNLATWITDIEAERALVLTVGDVCHRLWARRGQFALEDGQTPGDLAKTILAVTETGAPVELTYAAWSDPAPTPCLAPMALFTGAEVRDDGWAFDASGLLSSMPANATLDQLRQMLAMRDSLVDWGQGHPFAVTVIRQGRAPEVVASRKDQTTVRLVGQNWVCPSIDSTTER